MSYFGYDVPPERMEEAKKNLMTADARSKAILAEMQHSGLEKVENDRMWCPTPIRSPSCSG